MKQEVVWFWDAVASAEPYANNLTLLQTSTPTPNHSIFTGQMLFLMPNQQCQSTERQKNYLV